MLAGRLFVACELSHRQLRVASAHQCLANENRIDAYALKFFQLVSALVTGMCNHSLACGNINYQTLGEIHVNRMLEFAQIAIVDPDDLGINRERTF